MGHKQSGSVAPRGRRPSDSGLENPNNDDVADPITCELAALKDKGIVDLRTIWARKFRGPAPPIQSADVLWRLLAWRIQVHAFGDLDAESSSRLARLKSAHRRGKPVIPSPSLGLRPGTILTREWRGRSHRVLVLDQGFEHQSNRYNSLSQIARTITGTQWSGPRFFGLETDQAKPATLTNQANQ